MLTEMLLEGFGGSRTNGRERRGPFGGYADIWLPAFYLRLTFAICCRAAVPTGKKL